MILHRVPVDSDLTEAAIEVAMTRTYLPTHLVVSSATLQIAVKLAKKFSLTLCLDPDLSRDAWYIYGESTGVFSPGA